MKLFRWFYGFVQITVIGNELPRFLRLCSNKNLFVWDISFLEWNHVRLKMRASDLFLARDAFRKTNSRFQIEKKQGLPFVIWRFRKKSIFVFCTVGMLFALYFLSGFVWRIDIVGNSYLSEERIQHYLEEKNYGIGASIRRINPEEMERMMLKDFPEIIWNSVSIHGTTMHISIKEQIPNDVTDTKESSCEDLIAPIDGVVERFYIRNGTAAVHLGDEVKKGDVLVYGWIPIMNQDNTVMTGVKEGIADADVMVKGVYPIQCDVANTYKRHVFTGVQRKYWLIGFTQGQYDFVPIVYGGMQSTSLVKTKQILFMNTIPLPLYWNQVTKKEYMFETTTYTKPQLAALQQKNCENYIKKLEEKGIQIIDKNVMITYGNQKCTIKGDITGLCPADSYAPSMLPEVQDIGNNDL